MISLGTLHANNFSYRSDEDMDIIKVRKGALIVMRAKSIVGNIYKLLRNFIVGDVASVE